MKIISIRKLNQFDWILLSYPLFLFIPSLFLTMDYPISSNSLAYALFSFLGSLIVAPLFIYYYRILNSINKNKNINQVIDVKHIAIQPVKINSRSKTWITIICLLITCLVNILVLYLGSCLLKGQGKQQHSKLIPLLIIICLILLSQRFILKINHYNHHYYSLLLVALGLCGLFYPNISFSLSLIFSFLSALINFFIKLFFKVIMDKKYIDPLVFIFIYGILGLVLIGIGCLIIVCFDLGNEYTEDIFKFPAAFAVLFSNWNILYSICFIIVKNIIIIELQLIIYYKNPLTEFSMTLITEILVWLYMSIISFDALYFFISLFGCIFIFIGVMIYIELITIHCFGMDKNTKEAIEKRSNDDAELANGQSELFLLEID